MPADDPPPSRPTLPLPLRHRVRGARRPGAVPAFDPLARPRFAAEFAAAVEAEGRETAPPPDLCEHAARVVLERLRAGGASASAPGELGALAALLRTLLARP